ncbi:MAG: NAD-dependent epimerase/dehydratase family protein [Actinomycetota bacterium]|nr:NAD-dependent epimerase/dehydratase family protein [Actinomycetota bacterium]
MSEGECRPRKVLVTGARGFIGKNLVVTLKRRGVGVAGVDVDSTPEDLALGVHGASVVYHLAGVNRPERDEEFTTGNVGSLDALLAAIDQNAATNPTALQPLIVLSSSYQATQDNPYGRSKLAAEQALENYSVRTGTPAVIYRLPGVFGKWCRPNYNSVVATFCHNIARDLPIAISDPARVVELVYVDDVVAQFMTHLEDRPTGVTRGEVRPTFNASLGELAQRIRTFRAMRRTLEVADVTDPFTRRLLGTYTSYIPPSDLTYPLEQRSDPRGTLAELLKSPHFGQMFVSRTHPGVTRGNHCHDLKVEKFCVLEGDAVIRFRPILGDEVTEHHVSGTDFKVVDIPPGMTHSIENVGSTEMIVLFWASEILDREHPDTYFSEVLHG